MSRDCSLLDPKFYGRVQGLLKACADIDVVMKPYYTIRTPWEQARIWRKTRSTKSIMQASDDFHDENAHHLANILIDVGPQFSGPGARGHMTYAKPGYSWHQWGEAIDCFWLVNGEINWSTTEKTLQNDKNGYQVYGKTAEQKGLVSLGVRAGWDWNHIQKREEGSPQISAEEIDAEMLERFGLNESS